MNSFLYIGLIGFGATLAVNLIAMFTFEIQQAAFFSNGWWLSWFSHNYVVWIAFTLIGVGQKLSGKSSKGCHKSD